jgi:putative ATP-dependent endonuclease of OLD family
MLSDLRLQGPGRILTRIVIKNYRGLRDFSLELTSGLNILVGDNDSGKTTVLEAIRLALTGRVGDRLAGQGLSPYHFNQDAAAEYITKIRAGHSIEPPHLVIDVHLELTDATATLKGKNNLAGDDEPGLRLQASLDHAYAEEYRTFLQDPGPTALVPFEYYKVEWLNFAGNAVTRRGVPASVSNIDASSIRLQNGADYYLQQIINAQLEPKQRVELARAYRTLRETFADDPAIAKVNEFLQKSGGGLSARQLSLAIDISKKTAWENSLVPHLDDLPFPFVGHGSQSALKILLALERTAEESQVVLVEEPENHLSPASLNDLVHRISERCDGKQVIVSTHSSYVLNKLGLDSLVLLHDGKNMRLADVPADTLDYFKKLSGYDTLRLVLADRVILVEGPSDELIVQRAYLDRYGKLPIQDRVDVINVRGLSFRRFLDIAKRLGKRVAVVTDNDDKPAADVLENYKDYASNRITIHTGEQDAGRTLEPQMVRSARLATLNEILGCEETTEEALAEVMKKAKTDWALRVFESATTIQFPPYILEALDH